MGHKYKISYLRGPALKTDVSADQSHFSFCNFLTCFHLCPLSFAVKLAAKMAASKVTVTPGFALLSKGLFSPKATLPAAGHLRPFPEAPVASLQLSMCTWLILQEPHPES